MKLTTKLVLTILLFVAFFQNGSEATNHQEMNALYRKMFTELSKQSYSAFYARALRREEEPSLPVLSKSELGRQIYAKIDFLEGIFAELQAKRDQMQAEREYFVDENTVEMFLDFVKQKRGAGHKAKLFSEFPREKFENNQYFMFLISDEWTMDELIGRTYPSEFFEILDRILAVKRVPEEMGPESGIRAIYRSFQLILIKFIEELKLEIVVGQSHNDFDNLNERIQRNKAEIQAEIDAQSKGKMKTLQYFVRNKSSHQQNQKALFEKYKELNEASMELYNDLVPQITELMNKKGKKVKAKLSEDTFPLALELKKAFAEVMTEQLAIIATSSATTHSKATLWDIIQHDLCLPKHWLEDQIRMYAAVGKEARLRSSIHMNTAMLLLAYERMLHFSD